MNSDTESRFFIISILSVMVVFLPTTWIGTMSMDDYELLSRLEITTSNFDLWGLFFREKSTVYYRPFLAVINYLDYKIWGSSIPGFHLTNYIFHIGNAVLVYKIVFRLFRHQQKAYLLASISSLVFALNPLTTESVSWISGRSDIFGTFFALLALRCSLINKNWRYILTPSFIFLGICSKENAFAIVPVIFFLHLILLFDAMNTETKPVVNRQKIIHNAGKIGVWCFVLSLPLILYVCVRTWGGGSFDDDVQRIVAAGGQTNQALGLNFLGYFRVFPAMAFYLKKLIMPYPLNFSISSINYDLYSLIFFGILCLNLYLCIKRFFIIPVLTSLLIVSFLPALPIAIGGVAWTPFAERYLYLSLCVWGAIVAFLYHYILSQRLVKPFFLNVLMTIVILISVIGTVSRQMDWRSNEKIFEDTVTKIAADNYRAMMNYALSHGRKDRILYLKKAEEASKHSPDKQWRSKLFLAIAEYYATYDKNPFLLNVYESENISDYNPPDLTEKERVRKVLEYIDKGLELSQRSEILKIAVTVIFQLNIADHGLQNELNVRAKSYYKKLYTLKANDFYMYRIGNLEERLNDSLAASKAYETVTAKFPDSEWAKFASIRLDKINKKTNRSRPDQ